MKKKFHMPSIVKKILGAVLLVIMFFTGTILDGIADNYNIWVTLLACLTFLGCLAGLVVMFSDESMD